MLAALPLAACGRASDDASPAARTAATTSVATNTTAAPTTRSIPAGHDHFGSEPFTERRDAGRSADGRFLTLVQTNTFLVTEQSVATLPNTAQLVAADDFATATLSAIERFADVEVALAAGYVHLDGDPMHYVNPALLADDGHADPERPEALMYHDAGGGPVLLGAMFLEAGTAHGRQVGGPATPWHYHEYAPDPYCVVLSGFPVGEPDAAGRCAEGEIADRSPEMLHVWIHNPAGTFDGEVYTPTAEELARHFGA